MVLKIKIFITSFFGIAFASLQLCWVHEIKFKKNGENTYFFRPNARKSEEISKSDSGVTGIPVWAPKMWRPKNTFQVFFFQLYFIKKYIDVAINDFTKHLIRNGLEDKIADRREKQRRGKKRWSERRNCLRNCFHSFKYIIDHANVRFFFLNSLWACSHSLNDISSLHCFVWFLLYTCCIFSAQIAYSSHKFITIKIFYLNIWIF